MYKLQLPMQISLDFKKKIITWTQLHLKNYVKYVFSEIMLCNILKTQQRALKYSLYE